MLTSKLNIKPVPVVPAGARREARVFTSCGKLSVRVVLDQSPDKSKLHYLFEVTPGGNLRLVELLQATNPGDGLEGVVTHHWYSSGEGRKADCLLTQSEVLSSIPRQVVWVARASVLEFFTNRLEVEVAP